VKPEQPEQTARLRARNQVTLPAKVVEAAGRREGDLLRFSADRNRIVITAQEVRDQGRTYTWSELVGAASGLYKSAAEIDAEIEAGRAERPTVSEPGRPSK